MEREHEIKGERESVRGDKERLTVVTQLMVYTYKEALTVSLLQKKKRGIDSGIAVTK